jgi:hypothetical protein
MTKDLTASTGWVAIIALGLTLFLPFVARSAPRWRLVKRHQQIAYFAFGVMAVHVLIPIFGRALAAAPAAGLWIGGAGTAAVAFQILLGRRLRMAPQSRRARLKSVHLVGMAAVTVFAWVHVVTTADKIPSRALASHHASTVTAADRSDTR